MGFRFFKRIGLTKGVTLNLSKSGGSVSVGPQGAKLTLGPQGARVTLGIPGTGLFYTTNFSLGFLAGSVRIKGRRMPTPDSGSFTIEDVISLAFARGRISGPDIEVASLRGAFEPGAIRRS